LLEAKLQDFLNEDYPQPTKNFPKQKIYRELRNVTLAELSSKSIRQTLVFDLFTANWITTHLVCSSCRSTSVSTGTSNNQIQSIKSGKWWKADTTLSMRV